MKKEIYYLKKVNGEIIEFEFSYAGLRKAHKYVMEHDTELEHPFNDERVTIYYMEVTK